jgi:hypothetical protein
MVRTAIRVFVACVCWTLIASAQGKPDFSGRWTTDADPALAPPPTDPAARGRGAGPGAGRGGGRGDMGSGWGSTITIAQEPSRLTVEYAFFGRGDMQPPMRFAYPLDGSETKNTMMLGQGMQVQSSRSTWEGDKLVITTRHTFTNPDTRKPETAEVRHVLALESPTSLVVEVTRNGVLGGAPTTTKTVYRKI